MAGINLTPDIPVVVGQGTLFLVAYLIVKRWIMVPYSKLCTRRQSVTVGVHHGVDDVYAKIDERSRLMDDMTKETLMKVQKIRQAAKENATREARLLQAEAQEQSDKIVKEQGLKVAESLQNARLGTDESLGFSCGRTVWKGVALVDIGFLNFYVPGVNFVLFVLLFFFLFRGLFTGMAKKQRAEFLQAKTDAERERSLAEVKLQELLYKEQELSRRLHVMTQQAEDDSRLRAEQIIEDAKLHAAKIREETERLVRANFSSAKKQLREDLEAEVNRLMAEKLAKVGSRDQDRYVMGSIEEFSKFRQVG